MNLKSLIEKMDKVIAEGTKETPTGRVHKAEPGGYGRKDDEDDEGKKVQSQVKRGRGRPKKDADSTTGQVAKYDNAKNLQSFMIGNLPGGKAPGKKGQVHKIKDESVSEGSGPKEKQHSKYVDRNSPESKAKVQAAKEKMEKDKAAEPGKKLADKIAKKGVNEATKETPTGKIHKAEPGGYGRKDDEDDEGKKVQSQVKRGRGRPKKNADSDTGEVKKWDTDTLSKWIVGSKPKTLPGKASVKHKLKDWMEHVESRMIVESIQTEGRMSDIDLVFQDLVNGNADLYDVMNHPRDADQEYASKILHRKAEVLAGETGLHLDDDFEKIQELLMRDLEKEYDSELTEVSLDTSQVAVPRISAPGAQTQQPQQQAGQQGTQTGQQQAGTMQQPAKPGTPQMGAAVIDFKKPNDPLQKALQQAVKDKQVTVMSESVERDNAHASKLQGLLKNYPYERKMADEGWGMAESLYQALCDHYWEGGFIPREIMYGPSEKLREFVEECYMKDTQPVVENPLVGMAVRGAAMGAGSALADKMLNNSAVQPTVQEELFDEQLTEAEVEESGLQAYLGKKKYGEEGMEALQKAGREGASKEKMAQLRDKFDKLDKEDESKEKVDEVAPKGWEGTVKAMKKHKGEIDNPWALAHWMKGKGYKSHKKEESKDMQMEAWDSQLKSMLNEGMTVTTSTGNEGASDSVSISATDADAQNLMKILQHSGLMKSQSSAMSVAPDQDHHGDIVATVQPVSPDEVMGTLEPDQDGEEAFGFLKRMLGARAEHSPMSDAGHGDYEQEEGGECEECGHADCQCDHEEVDEMHNETASSGDAHMSPVPEEEEMEEGNLFTGNLAKARAAGKKEADLDGDGDMEKVDEEDMEEGNLFTGNLAKARAAGKKEADLDGDGDMEKVDEESLDQPATMEEKRCDECGGVMESDHQCEGSHEQDEEKLDEWANSVNDSDEKFLADLTFMTKTLSGGLNNMKQDQTTLPSTRVKTSSESNNPDLSMAAMLKKLSNIN